MEKIKVKANSNSKVAKIVNESKKSKFKKAGET